MSVQKLDIKDYPDKKIIEIEGVKYSYALFTSWAKYGLPVDIPFKIVRKNDDVVYLEKVDK